MPVLLTVLSVVIVWAFLTVLVVGLLLILKGLQSIRGHLERIAMGVRAIEQETRPLAARAGELTASLQEAEGGVVVLVERLESVDRDLGAAVWALRHRPNA